MERTLLCQRITTCIYQEADGTITSEQVSGGHWEINFDKLKEMYLSYGFKGYNDRAAYQTLEKFVGKNIKDFQNYLDKRSKIGGRMREKRQVNTQRWQTQVKRMTNLVLNVGDVDEYDYGVNIWILLNTQYSFGEQKQYINERVDDVVCFIKEELQSRHKKKDLEILELLRYMSLVEVTLTRHNQAVFRFEVKKSQYVIDIEADTTDME